MHFNPPDFRIAGHALWNVPCTTVEGSLEGSSRVSFSRREAASIDLMLWPCVARIRKCVGSVSCVAVRAFWVAVSWALLVSGVGRELGSGVSVVAVAVAVGCSASEGMWRSANRFLSESATACMISGRVTFRDLSFRHASWKASQLVN